MDVCSLGFENIFLGHLMKMNALKLKASGLGSGIIVKFKLAFGNYCCAADYFCDFKCCQCCPSMS